MPHLPHLEWTSDDVPCAASFDDVYFSRDGGLAEAETVFLAGCGLPQAWRNKDRFAVCELGFGTGLNVLATWRSWKKTRPPHAILHISTIEAFPLARDDAARALAQFPEVGDLAALLLARWPVRAYAPQRLWFPEDGFALTVFVGEAETILRSMAGRFDAWFLDGFAPGRNAEMWSDPLIAQIARLSALDTRVASFTVAGGVRRALESVGFVVEKKPGFGAKKERLEARFETTHASSIEALREREQASIFPYAPRYPKRVAVIGAGIAGAACAYALGRRNVETIVLEAAPAFGAGASGNPAGLVMPRLDRDGALREVFLAAYIHALAIYDAMGESAFTRCGVEERAGERGAAALADLLADPPLPEDWLSPLPDGGALHARGGLLRPAAAAAEFLRRAEVLYETPVGALERVGDAWVLRSLDGRAVLKADAVILACGAALTRFEPARFLPIELSRGQIEWGSGTSPPRAVTRGSYAAPFDGGLLFGATFDKVSGSELDWHGDENAHQNARQRNIEALAAFAPDLAASIDASTLNSRASLRAAMPDRAPIAGLLPDAPAWCARYAGLAHGRLAEIGPPPTHDGLYVVAGLGARGLTLAPLLGERIASEMFGEPLPLSQAALDAIHPARFLLRALKRGKP
jgi:tRNA 5-methylaminomethyl-2-thiouridine biosynthesis bifunctional protein